MFYAYACKTCIAADDNFERCQRAAHLYCDENMRSGSVVVITYKECATDEDGDEHMFTYGHETYVPDDGDWWDYE